MELLNPTQQSNSGFSSFSNLRPVCDQIIVQEEVSTSNSSLEKIYVAVGKSVEKGASLIQWSIKHFEAKQICILFVHQPSQFIPTLLGKLPVSQANAEVVLAHRREERELTKKVLEHYLAICRRAKVVASIVTIECDQVAKGITELVNRLEVRKLVMGAASDNCTKVKKSSKKVNHVVKTAPLFCEIWFINKGKHVWTREAHERSNHLKGAQDETLKSKSFRHSKDVSSFYTDYLRSHSDKGDTCARVNDWAYIESNCSEELVSPFRPNSANEYFPQSAFSPTSGSSRTSTERRVSLGSDSKTEEENLYCQLAESSDNEALKQLLQRRKLEFQAMEAMSKIKIFESAYANELKHRKKAENALRITIQKQEKLLKEKEEIIRELQKSMRSVSLLDNRVREANSRKDEALGELKVIQTSISSLRLKKQSIQRQKMEAVRWLDRWRNHGTGGSNCNEFLGFVEELPQLAEFSLSDLETATCNFSESFKLVQEGYGCVYKGEMLGRTVAIKKLHPHTMQGQSEFQKEVQVLGKLKHPHLVTLLGSCPEAWSLVYEFLPNGILSDYLSRKSNRSPMTWKVRARIIAEISSALCFLHSSKPEKIVHGDLKPQNILLDSELSCKICEFGICRLVTDDNLYCPSFRRGSEPKTAFPYTDPEFHRVGVLTTKSDIYSFGVIVLQLLTGKPPVRLASEVRRAMSNGKLASILDPSAGEWPTFVARRLVELGMQFCGLNSRERPELTPALVRELEQLHVSEERPVPSFFLCPILQEIMHDPQVAADGFTYEGEALRGWLKNGRETSPMTNLKLSHLHLIPNHALRLAIQDWLCKS